MNFKFLILIVKLIFIFNLSNAQNRTEKEALSELSFMVGEWQGSSTIYDKDSIKTSKVSKKVNYLLDGNLLSVEVNSPHIHSHSIIRYSVSDNTYYYYPFSKTKGGSIYKGRMENGKFVVIIDKTYKVIFERTDKGQFKKYGERIIKGKKVVTFKEFLKPILSISQQKMKDLSFLVGEWMGQCTSYKDGKIIAQAPTFNRARYDVKNNIIVIDYNAKATTSHTVIYYDKEEDTYYYQYFTDYGKNNKLPAKLKNGQLIVKANEKLRYIFGKIDGGHGEVAERLVDGEWVKFYEDRVVNTN